MSLITRANEQHNACSDIYSKLQVISRQAETEREGRNFRDLIRGYVTHCSRIAVAPTFKIYTHDRTAEIWLFCRRYKQISSFYLCPWWYDKSIP